MALLWSKITLILLFYIYYVNSEKFPYDSYSGVKLSEDQYSEYVKENKTFCINLIQSCDPEEGRRTDGSCNNLKYPSRGSINTPQSRMLPAVYDRVFGWFGDYQLRKASDGKPFPPTRELRTSLFPEGKVPNQEFTHLVTNFLAFIITDVISVQDTAEFALGKTVCCLGKGKSDPPTCAPNYIPDDDPVFRYSNQRCINMTRPDTFQRHGCIKNYTVPENTLLVTSEQDLSNIYESLSKNRLFKKGLLKYETDVHGRIWPPSDTNKPNACVANKKPRETRCFTPSITVANSLLGLNLYITWFWRNHNRIALALHKLNRCWNDQLLFDTARDINIATMSQMLYYELFPLLFGKSNMLNDGIISSDPGFRDIYNDELFPQTSMEFAYGFRWFHGMQESSIHMYDGNGNYLKEIPVVELVARTGYLPIDNNIEHITQGSFRQGCAKGDNIVDPDMANRAFATLQKVLDVFTNDWAKGRYFGMQPYVAYRKQCFGEEIKSFDDLKKIIEPENLEKLKEAYKSVKDIELMPGFWLERKVKGGYIPETLYCFFKEQLKRFVTSDRHWYERPNRPNAFTAYQLSEIRKASMARFLCDVGDKVTKIQPSAFSRIGPGNEITDCKNLPHIDLSAWKDESCNDATNPIDGILSLFGG